jgi:hypothetical protein
MPDRKHFAAARDGCSNRARRRFHKGFITIQSSHKNHELLREAAFAEET